MPDVASIKSFQPCPLKALAIPSFQSPCYGIYNTEVPSSAMCLSPSLTYKHLRARTMSLQPQNPVWDLGREHTEEVLVG